MEIGLYFGSFNPIHMGHLILANYIVEYSNLDEVWFVISPHNPLKQRAQLLDDYQRLHLVNLAIDDFPKFRSCDIEFRMPKPSYTIDTLAYLGEQYSEHHFTLIMGEDNLTTLHKWKNYELLVENNKIMVYPRPNSKPSQFHNHKNVQLINAPQIDISSSFIRQSIAEGKNVRFFLPNKAWQYIDEMNFYKTKQ